MVMKMGKVTVIGHPAEATLQECTDCGKLKELRPYGKNAAMVCFDCAMKDEPNAAAMFLKQLNGDS